MSMIILIFWVAELLFLGLYIKTCWPERTRESFYIKIVCSSIFLLYAIMLAVLIRYGAVVYPKAVETSAGANTFLLLPNGKSATRIVHLIIAALAYGWLGDVFLGYTHQIELTAKKEELDDDGKSRLKSKVTAFNGLGILAFLLGHLLYTVGFARGIAGYEFTLRWWSFLLFLLPLALYGYIAGSMHIEKRDAIVTGAYFLSIGAMFGTAVTLGLSLWPVHHLFSACLTVGALFFFCSDIMLTLETYSERFKKFGLRVTRQVVYFTGQMLLATTILFFYTV